MIPIRIRQAALIKACLLAIGGAAGFPAIAQAQYFATAETQIAATGDLAPLKLPPLPRKKIPTKTFDDWTQHCTSQPGVPGQKCLLTQTVFKTNNQRKHALLAITIGYLGPNKEPAMLLRVPLALGVYLPPGLKFSVPGTEPVRMIIQSCRATGCSARTPLAPDLIAVMKNSDAGSLELYTVRKQLIRMPISFKGFAMAFDSLTKD